MNSIFRNKVAALAGAFVVFACVFAVSAVSQAKQLNVVVTQTAFKSIAEAVGGDKVIVSAIVKGNQDPHIVRPKPSLAAKLKQADVFVATGLDLELWAPPLVDMSNNPNIRSGQKGYVAASAGIQVSEKPTTVSRAEGDVHVYGNPHIHTSPLHGKIIAENICTGLCKVAPKDCAFFKENLERFKNEVDVRTFGKPLVEMLGAKTLTRLAEQGKLVSFLEGKEYKGKKLIDLLGGWMKKALPLRHLKIVTFHKNWGYFTTLFGIEVIGYMEPKPGIPPSPGHVSSLIQKMKKEKVKVMLAANYFDVGKVRSVANKVNAEAVITALSPEGESHMDTFFHQFDIWIDKLLAAANK
ncbi:MAG: zinc ABC transporter substrate-binding protein [Deltaproteobacteria bacterium]|nr:zinc ABC transporter substrate-binding protein [Deltaproteobacteria bacterium]MBN2670849.1 zinc ABC transporter substrate-binding protein [Deltaproteobacteria bacterium]